MDAVAVKAAKANLQWLYIFAALFLFRYVRSVVNAIAFYHARPTPIPSKPKYHPSDITVILTTLDILNSTVSRTIESILAHPIKKLIISSTGTKATSQAQQFLSRFPDKRILLVHTSKPNRRHQFVAGVNHVSTPIVCLSDDHVFLPSYDLFFPSLLAPFQNPKIGSVAPVITVHNHHFPLLSWRGFWNYLGMTYIVRRTQEYLATQTIDGGLCVVPARFCLFRTDILTDKYFTHAYLNEYIFFNLIGPLNVDDDNFHTRWMELRGWRFKIQSSTESRVETVLGEYPMFIEQWFRWTRTMYRSDPRSLVMGNFMLWLTYPWTVYTHFLYGFVRFSLFYEILMFWTLGKGVPGQWMGYASLTLAVWIIGMKFVKLLPHFVEYPKDLVYFPAGMLFGYVCSFMRVWVMLTWWDLSWGKAVKEATVQAEKEE